MNSPKDGCPKTTSKFKRNPDYNRQDRLRKQKLKYEEKKRSNKRFLPESVGGIELTLGMFVGDTKLGGAVDPLCG